MTWLQPSRDLINSATSDEYRLPMLHWAVAGGHKSTIKYLLERGANVDETAKHGLTILHILALFRQRGGGKEFPLPDEALDNNLATSRTQNFYKEAPLHLAAAYQTTQARSVQILLRIALAGYVAPRNALDETPVHRAAALDNPQVINALVPLMPHSVNFLDRYGRSPVWHAAATGSKEAMDALVALGASVHLADDLGLSPLHAACREGHVGCMVALLRAGADPCATTFKHDLTPIDLAVMFGHHRILDICLGKEQYAGAWQSTNLTQDMLDRLLHIASSRGHLECAKSLVEATADPYVSFDYYFSSQIGWDFATVISVAGKAREIAARKGFVDVVHFLDKYEKPSQRLLIPWTSPDTAPSHLAKIPPNLLPYNPSEPSPPPAIPGYSTTLPARASAYPGQSLFQVGDVARPPVADQPKLGPNRLWVVDNPPGAYWHPDHGPAGCYFFELQGESTDKVARPLDGMYRSGVPHNLPPLVYMGNAGFEKYKRLPSGGFALSGQAEMAEALRLQNWRVRREEERRQGQTAAGAGMSDGDAIAQASHLHELDDTHVDSLPQPEGFASGDEKPPPLLVYAGAEGHWRYHRWAGGGFGYILGRNVAASGGAGEERREEEAAWDRVRDAHLFRAATLARAGSRAG
jgi:ankyrin repeat protein